MRASRTARHLARRRCHEAARLRLALLSRPRREAAIAPAVAAAARLLLLDEASANLPADRSGAPAPYRPLAPRHRAQRLRRSRTLAMCLAIE